MELQELKSVLESLLLASGEPVSIARLAAACDDEPVENVKKALEELAQEYRATRRGFVLEEIAGGYQLRTALENAPYVRRLLASRQTRLSRPVLETLAIIAYRQPITRSEIEQLRGVDCAGVLDTLLNRRLIRVAGRKPVPGRPLMYATTQEFLEVFGLDSLTSLPRIDDLRALEERLAAKQPAGESESNQSGEPLPFGQKQDASGSLSAKEPSSSSDDRLALSPTKTLPATAGAKDQKDEDITHRGGSNNAELESPPDSNSFPDPHRRD